MKPKQHHLNALARAQSGVFSVAQAEGLGWSTTEIAHRRQDRQWVTVHRGVVRMATWGPTWENRLLAGALFLGERAVASHATAARLHSLVGFEASDTVEFTAVLGHRNIGGSLVVHTARQLALIDTETPERALDRAVLVDPVLARAGVVTHIRATSPTRTIIDLAARVTATALGNLVDISTSRGLTAPWFLAQRLTALRDRGGPGVRLLSEVLLDAGGHSWLERRYLALMRTARLPRPECQVVFRDGTATVARVDFRHTGTRVIVEVSGRRGHVSEADRRRDARRRNALQQAGYLVLEFVTTDVIDDSAYVVATVRAALSGAPSPLHRVRAGRTRSPDAN